MSETYTINSISQAHESMGLPPPKHPLITVIRARDLQRLAEFRDVRVIVNLYRVIFKGANDCGTLLYGKNSYDYQNGTLVFTAPGQVTEYEGEIEADTNESEGWTLAFHPDLIRKSDLGKNISSYSFFNYDVSEALHLSEVERKTIEELLDKIITEYSLNLDRHSHNLITKSIELLLDYCLRFYDRQFYTRSDMNSDIVSKFERLIRSYYQSGKADALGIPTVNYCGKELGLSPNYLGDLLKKETGKTAQEHIHLFIIEKAKSTLLNSTDSISQIGYNLGFEYPQYFSKLFKSKTGLSPREYRNLN